MDTRFETSFIPQQPLLRVEGTQRRREHVSLSLLFALIIFFATIAVAGGVYYLREDAERKLSEAKHQLDEREKNINIDEITSLKLLSTRFEAAEKVLSNHVALSAVLDLLEETTSVNVGFTSFAFSQSGDAPGVALIGEAPSYMTVYLQAEDLRKHPLIKQVDIANIALSEATGIVGFSMNLKLDPDLTKYPRYYNSIHAPAPVVDQGLIPVDTSLPLAP